MVNDRTRVMDCTNIFLSSIMQYAIAQPKWVPLVNLVSFGLNTFVKFSVWLPTLCVVSIRIIGISANHRFVAYGLSLTGITR